MKKLIAASLITIAASFGLAGTAQAGTPEENTIAMNDFTATVEVATVTGGLIGTGIGFLVGCVAGGAVTAPTVVFMPLGCLATGATVAMAGGVIGTLIAGGPTVIIKGVEMAGVLLKPAS